MEEQIISEWNKIKPNCRVWQKVKCICFNDEGKPVAMKIDAYRQMMNDQKKDQMNQ